MSSISVEQTDTSTAPNDVWKQLRTWLSTSLWPVFGLVMMTILVYAPVVNFGFLNWDDTWYIVNNDLIKSWHPANLYRIVTEPVARNFAPITIGTFLIEHTLWGLWPGGYHVTNVLLHALNSVLVFALVGRITQYHFSENTGSQLGQKATTNRLSDSSQQFRSSGVLIAWTIAAIFALHPVQVETVAWISSRKTLLSTTFMLASFMCWLRVERTSRHEGWGMTWLLLGLMTKASVVVIPPIVVVWDVLIGRKNFAETAAKQIIPMFFCVMSILITMGAQTTIVGGIRSHIGASKLWIFAIDCTVLWRYVGMLLVPQDLCVLYDPATSGIPVLIAAAIVGWGIVMVSVWRLRDRNPMVAFCFVTWILLLIPVLNLFPITTLMNDRYLYLPLVPFFCGIMLIGRGLVSHIKSRFDFALPQPQRFSFATLASLAIVGAYCWGTLSYLPVWSQPLTLWHYAQQETPSLTVVQIQYAITLRDLGAIDDARETLYHALQTCNPDELDRGRIDRMLEELAEREQNGDKVDG